MRNNKRKRRVKEWEQRFGAASSGRKPTSFSRTAVSVSTGTWRDRSFGGKTSARRRSRCSRLLLSPRFVSATFFSICLLFCAVPTRPPQGAQQHGSDRLLRQARTAVGAVRHDNGYRHALGLDVRQQCWCHCANRWGWVFSLIGGLIVHVCRVCSLLGWVTLVE